MQLPEIIGIAGTNGSGKDTLADLRLLRRQAFKIGLSDILRAELDTLGLEQTRENLRMVSGNWARESGPGFLAQKALNDYFDHVYTDVNTGLSIVSIARPGEASVIKDAGGMLIWIDADQDERFVHVRDGKRGRNEDMVSFEKFKADDDKEMFPGTTDLMVPNKSLVREMADVSIWNDFPSEPAYKAYLEEAFDLAE